MTWARFAAAALTPLLLVPLAAVYEASLRDPARPSGWALLACVVSLTLFGLRKRVPVLRLGSARSWLRLHFVVGWAAVVAFLVHAGVSPPHGVLERILYVLFVVTTLSGVLGLFLDRLVPVRLASAPGEEELFERIPARREELRREVEAEVLACTAQGEGRAIANLYVSRLLPWFVGPAHRLEHALDLERTQGALLAEVRALERYASPREREALALIADRVARKDALDFRHAQHLLLRSWLIVHVSVTWALIAAAGLHATLASLFGGGS